MKNNLRLLFFLCLSISLLYLPCRISCAPPQATIYIIPIKGVIDLGLSAFIKRAVNEAKQNNAQAVIFEIDTFGGRVDAADEIANILNGLSPIPTYAYVTNSAWSAGALIALACKTIIMNKSSSIGSAEPRAIGFSTEQQTTDEKMISALRAKFKATAEANNHSGNLAQAMVDKDITLIKVEFKKETLILTQEELDKKKNQYGEINLKDETIICPKDKLLNLTADEALDLKLAASVVTSDKEFLSHVAEHFSLTTEQLNILRPSPTWSENLVRFLTHPIISSLLLSLGFLGLFFELKIPGWGVSGTLGAIFIVLFFWGHYLAGLANWVDILIVITGIVFLFIEIFVTPGFGIAGVSGIILIITGLILTMIKYPVTFPQLQLTNAVTTIAYASAIVFAAMFFSLKYIPRTSLWKRITLQTKEDKALGFQIKSLPEDINVGKIGLAKTMLRPSGRALFDTRVFDVITYGEFIAKDKKIQITKLEGNKIFVEEIKEA
ncbi:MAG: hypothetical protein KJ893_08040 [Candidatus Omnitrophica bacterium]|nr:hypothetical protein [Candidatus Omnitrophota bacterium]MBU4477929.1 hypothetical protein [Candidatus Omnitrophota bacterium]MCG2703843.1 hypothetical protein [Candidatus Omnitrophota bacterium]